MTINARRHCGVLSLIAAWLLALCVVARRAPAQNSSTPAARKADYAELSQVPAKARATRNPLEGDPDAALAGRKLFEQHCSECHGQRGEGGKRGPSLRVKEIRDATPGMLFFVLSNGVVRRGMPDWSKLPEPQRWQIVSFLQSLRD